MIREKRSLRYGSFQTSQPLLSFIAEMEDNEQHNFQELHCNFRVIKTQRPSSNPPH